MVTNSLSGVVNSFTETEKQMVSVERAQQYIEQEPKLLKTMINQLTSSVTMKSTTSQVKLYQN